MATRGRIAIKRKDGSYLSIYNNSDSGPDFLGKTLNDHWNDDAIIQEAIQLGDCSSWNETIEENRYYGRDYDEVDTGPMVSKNIQTLLDEGTASWEEYVYVRENHEWSMFHNRKKVNLKKYLEKENT